MIYDVLTNTDTYSGLHSGILQVLKAAKQYTPENFPSGKIQLDGNDVYLNMANFETHAPEGALSEAHHCYIDVMVMVEGTETIYVKNTDKLQEITTPYDQSRDALFAKLDADALPVHMEPGNFIVLFPQDAHAPGCHADGPSKVKKIVGKVRISTL